VGRRDQSICEDIEGTLNRRDPKKEASGIFEELRSHRHIKAKDVSKADRETMNDDLKGWGGRETSIASETLLPTEPPMGSLGTGKHIREGNILSRQMH
jgi:hypothetical protein